MSRTPSPIQPPSPNTGFHAPSLVVPPTVHFPASLASSTVDDIKSDSAEIIYQLKTILTELKATREAAHDRPFGWRDTFSALAVLAGLVTGGIFGYYAKPAYSAALQANALAHAGLRAASLANVLTLTSLCYSAPVGQLFNPFNFLSSSCVTIYC